MSDLAALVEDRLAQLRAEIAKSTAADHSSLAAILGLIATQLEQHGERLDDLERRMAASGVQ